MTLDHGRFHAAVAPAPFGPIRWSTEARAERLTSRATAARTALTVESALSLSVGQGGAWLGAALERSPDMDSMPSQPLLRAGLWRSIGGVVLTLTSASHATRLGGKAASSHIVIGVDTMFNDTTHTFDIRQTSRSVVDSGQASRTRLWSEVALSAAWARGPVAIDAAFGARPAVSAFPRAVWGNVSAAVQVTPRVAMIASAGNDPARITMGIPQTRVATLGVRLSSVSLLRPPSAIPVRTSAAAFSLRSVSPNSYVVSVRATRARTVELSGDFDHWQPIALSETQPDVWETTLVLPPGTYRMNLRVDGDVWKAPPGVATVADEFNGTVGIVVVR